MSSADVLFTVWMSVTWRSNVRRTGRRRSARQPARNRAVPCRRTGGGVGELVHADGARGFEIGSVGLVHGHLPSTVPAPSGSVLRHDGMGCPGHYFSVRPAAGKCRRLRRWGRWCWRLDLGARDADGPEATAVPPTWASPGNRPATAVERPGFGRRRR